MAKTVTKESARMPRAQAGRRSSAPRRRDHVLSLTPISEAMGADKSPKEILQLILKSAFSITRASSASLMLIDDATETLSVEAAEGFNDDKIFNTRLAVGQGVTGWVAETGVPLRIGNVRKDPRYVRVQGNLRSELAVPLKIGGKLVGVISVDSTRLNHFTAEDEALLMSLAAQSARVIHSTRLYEEARRRAEELELLNEVSRGLISSLDLKEVLANAVDQTAKVCRAAIVSVFLLNDNGRSLEMAACHGGSDSYRNQPSFRLDGCFLAEVLDSDKAVLIPDAHARNKGSEFYLDPHTRALVSVPLISKNKPLGMLCVFSGENRDFDAHDLGLLESLARSAALAIENARSHRKIVSAEEALRAAEKFSMLGELAAGLAHEIRNPLTSIKMLFESLRKNSRLSAESEGDGEMISKQISRLETIVEGYLATARAQVAPTQHKSVDLNATVDESMLLLATSAHEGQRMRIEVCDGELPVKGDATQLSQVVYNLVLNAIQAVEKRGRITVSTGWLKTGGEKTGEVFMEVADDGPGLPEQVQLKLFQPFVTTKKGGVGLGLSIVKRIVEAHGGRLEVESPRRGMDRGALFRAVLPAANSEESAA